MTHKIQIDDEVRDATPKEAAEIEAREAQAIAEAEAKAAKVEAKAALLDRLGMTADEAALLLG
jgi:hypothetical protein